MLWTGILLNNIIKKRNQILYGLGFPEGILAMLKKVRFKSRWLAVLALALISLTAGCQQNILQSSLKSTPSADVLSAFSYTVSMDEPAANRFRVVFQYQGAVENEVELKMPAW